MRILNTLPFRGWAGARNLWKKIVPIKIASHWLAIYNITPLLIKLAHFLDTCWRKSSQSWQCSPKLFTNRFNGSSAPKFIAGVIRDILAHTIDSKSYHLHFTRQPNPVR